MSNPINRSPSGIIFFGNNGPEAVFQSIPTFVYDTGNNYIGINTSSPNNDLDIRGKTYTDSYYTRLADSGNIASSVVLNMDDSNLHQLTLSGASINVSVTGIDVGQRFIIRAKQDNVGGRTINWFSGIRWPGGVAPTLSTTTGVADLIGFIVTSTSPPKYDGFLMVTGIY